MDVILFILAFGILLAIPAYGLFRQEKTISESRDRRSAADRDRTT